MEAVISSAIVPNGKLLIINNGVYGERFANIAKTYGIEHINLKFDLNGPLNLERIVRVLKEENIDSLAAVHHETTTGILNPIEEIGKIAERFDCTYIVDTVSSFAGVPFSVRDCKIDFTMSTSNKCIQGLPGVSFVIGNSQYSVPSGW